jgi:predicted permease
LLLESRLQERLLKLHLRLIALIGVLVPRRLRADWRHEWEAELQYREALLAEWDHLDWRNKLDLLWRSTSAFWDALSLQPRRLEDEMLQDLRYGVRMLLKTPVFTAMAVMSLGLGIGANAAIFSLLDTVLLKNLPVDRPSQLVFLERSGAPEYKRSSNIDYAAFERLRADHQVLSGLCSFSYVTRINASFDGQGEMIEGQLVSGGFFLLLGVKPAAGRLFTEEEDNDAAQGVAVISYGYWQRRFGLNPSAVGQPVSLNNTPFTIIGVTPPQFFGVIGGSAPDVFLPSMTADSILPPRLRARRGPLPFVMARLIPGVSEKQAAAALTVEFQQARLAEAGSQLSPEGQQAIRQQTLALTPAGRGFSALRQQYGAALRLLMGLVGLVLLIACANVANLLLARAAARRREIAMRLALGASRLRLVRQLLTESLLLALLGAGFGLLLARWCSGLLLSVLSSGRNPISAGSRLTVYVGVDGRVLGFAILISLLAALLFGLAPACRATRSGSSAAIRHGSRHPGLSMHFPWDRLLVVGQVALSLTLVVGAGLFIRSLMNLRHVDLGFKREKVLVFSVDPQLIGYQGAGIANLYKKMTERITAIAGVSSASLSRQGLLNGGGTQGSIRIPGRPTNPEEDQIITSSKGTEWNAPNLCQVGPRFFETAGMTILRGRDFGPQDNETTARVAIVNESFARYYFGGDDPIGQRIDRGPDDGGEVEIVGIAKDAKLIDVQEQSQRAFYIPYLQDQSAWRETTFQVRTVGDPLNLITAIRREVRLIDPNLSLFRVRTLEAQVDESLGQERLVATLASLFGALALLLAVAGLYGVLSYSISRRVPEIGIRMALGSQPGKVLLMILREAYALVLAGVALGAAASLAAERLITGMLFGLPPADPLTLLLAILAMIAASWFAAWLPARRAASVDPMVALRYE